MEWPLRPEYYVQLVCPYCFRSKWIVARIHRATCEILLNRRWQCECPVHGRICVKPLQVQEKRAVLPEEQTSIHWLQ